MVGKQVLAYEDTLSKESSWINKYDFFDSDGISKSATGTVAKLLVKSLPYFIPYVNVAYGGLTAGLALSQLAPSLMKAVNGIAGGNNESDFMRSVDKVESFTSRFNSSVSDYSQARMFTLENLGSIIYDVSSQVYQQKVVAQIPKLFTLGKVTKNAQQAGRALSLAYMAGTSSREAYNQFKEAGASDRVAGLGMLASIGAMYGLMNTDYFRGALFKGTYLDESEVKGFIGKAINHVDDAIRGEMGSAREASNFVIRFGNRIKSEAEKAIANLPTKITKEGTEVAGKSIGLGIAKGIGSGVSALGRVGSGLGAKVANSTMLSRSVNEALEEVSEEASADMVKALFQGASSLGIPMDQYNDKLEFLWSGQDMAQRYLMSLFGGAIGGPIFELHNQ